MIDIILYVIEKHLFTDYPLDKESIIRELRAYSIDIDYDTLDKIIDLILKSKGVRSAIQ